jgi:DNA-binding NarL/FixJ family response regulator
MSTRIRVGVVDAHDLLLAGARALLSARNSPADFVVGANTVDGLIDSGQDLDVVVLDVRLADGSTARDNVRRLRAEGWCVLLHADVRHREAGPALLQSPAAGLVWKNDGARALASAGWAPTSTAMPWTSRTGRPRC